MFSNMTKKGFYKMKKHTRLPENQYFEDTNSKFFKSFKLYITSNSNKKMLKKFFLIFIMNADTVN